MTVRRQPALFFFAPLVAYLTVLFLVAALFLHPPLLGWIGFVVAAAIGVTAASLALRLFPRSEATAERRHSRPNGHLRLLVVLDASPPESTLAAAVRSRSGGRRADVHVVAPVLASPIHFLADDVSAEAEAAHERLGAALGELAASGVQASGEVGGDDPLQAIGDALGSFAADEILLVTRVPSRRTWLESGLERDIRDQFGIYVSVVLGPERAPAPRRTSRLRAPRG